MTNPTTTPQTAPADTIGRVAHLACQARHQQNNHGICGAPILGVSAPDDAKHCPTCTDLAKAPWDVSAVACAQHRP